VGKKASTPYDITTKALLCFYDVVIVLGARGVRCGVLLKKMIILNKKATLIFMCHLIVWPLKVNGEPRKDDFSCFRAHN